MSKLEDDFDMALDGANVTKTHRNRMFNVGTWIGEHL